MTTAWRKQYGCEALREDFLSCLEVVTESRRSCDGYQTLLVDRRHSDEASNRKIRIRTEMCTPVQQGEALDVSLTVLALLACCSGIAVAEGVIGRL